MDLNFSKLLKDAVNRAGIKKQVDASLALEKFMETVQEIFLEKRSMENVNAILKELNPVHLKDGVLTVACLNPSLSQELKLREKTIIYRLNGKLGQNMVGKIIYII